MLKLAQAGASVYCKLSKTEFKFLAQVNDPADVQDNSAVDLLWVKTLTDSISQFAPYITEAKTTAEKLAVVLGNMIT